MAIDTLVQLLPTGQPKVVPLHRTTSRNLNQVSEMLKKSGWGCFPGDADRSRVFVQTSIPGRNGTYRVALHVAESHVKVYVLSDVTLPESTRAQVDEYVSKVNRKSIRGSSLQLNAANGELQFQYALIGVVVSWDLVQSLVAASLLTMDLHYPHVLGIAHGVTDASSALQESSLTLTV